MKRDPLPATMPLAPGHAAGWARLLPAFAVVVIVICVAYAPTAAGIVSIWYRSTTFAHGFLVVPIAAWLAWRKREELLHLQPAPWLPALAALALLGVAWLAGQFADVNAVSQAAFVGMLIVTVPVMLGRDVARTLAFPLAFLLFAVPIGDFLLPLLMDRTADFTVWALRMTGVPVYREGWLLVVPNGRWSIVEACSGIRYLIASIMTGTLFAYLTYRAIWRRVAFVAFAAAVSILANWLRAYLIVLLGHLSNNRLAAGVDHLVYGWIFFGIVMIGVFWIGSKWREPTDASAKPEKFPLSAVRVTRNSAWTAAAALAVVALAWPLANFATRASSDVPVSLAVSPPAGWEATSDTFGFEPHFAEPSAALHQTWRSGDDSASVYVAYYRGQSPERKAVSADNRLTTENDQRWVRTIRSTPEVTIGGAPRRIVETHLNGRAGSLIVWQWFWVDGTVTSSDALAKLRIAWSRLSRGQDDAAAIIVYTADGSNGRDTLQRFVHDAWPAIAASLRHADSAQ